MFAESAGNYQVIAPAVPKHTQKNPSSEFCARDECPILCFAACREDRTKNRRRRTTCGRAQDTGDLPGFIAVAIRTPENNKVTTRASPAGVIGAGPPSRRQRLDAARRVHSDSSRRLLFHSSESALACVLAHRTKFYAEQRRSNRNLAQSEQVSCVKTATRRRPPGPCSRGALRSCQHQSSASSSSAGLWDSRRRAHRRVRARATESGMRVTVAMKGNMKSPAARRLEAMENVQLASKALRPCAPYSSRQTVARSRERSASRFPGGLNSNVKAKKQGKLSASPQCADADRQSNAR